MNLTPKGNAVKDFGESNMPSPHCARPPSEAGAAGGAIAGFSREDRGGGGRRVGRLKIVESVRFRPGAAQSISACRRSGGIGEMRAAI